MIEKTKRVPSFKNTKIYKKNFDHEGKNEDFIPNELETKTLTT